MTAVVERSRPARLMRRHRSTKVLGGLAVATLAAFVATLTVGSAGLSVGEVVASLSGLGADPAVDFIVRELRLPSASAGLAVGLTFGISGVIFQRLFANPLASPDFVGVTSGASLFAVAALVLLPSSAGAVGGFAAGTSTLPMFAILGSAVSTLLIYLLAWRDGISGFRFILIGIGVSTFFLSLTSWLIAMAEITDARAGLMWLTGSVGLAGPVETRVLLIVAAVGIPLAMLVERQASLLELGDDTAAALGLRVESARRLLIAVAVVFIGAGTAVVGPIGFVALMAGPIARRLLGAAPGLMPAAALVGAVLVLVADLVGTYVFPAPVPTGVVTGLVGAPYLCWQIVTVNREGRGG